MEKIPCLICKKLFLRPCTHARQKHNISARDYKKMFGLDTKKGIMTEEQRKVMQEHSKNNPHTITENLIKQGKKSRFQPNHKINYERSEQTLERLKIHWLKIQPKRKPAKRIKLNCENCGKPIIKKQSQLQPHNYCSRSCSTTANNKKRTNK